MPCGKIWEAPSKKLIWKSLHSILIPLHNVIFLQNIIWVRKNNSTKLLQECIHHKIFFLEIVSASHLSDYKNATGETGPFQCSAHCTANRSVVVFYFLKWALKLNSQDYLKTPKVRQRHRVEEPCLKSQSYLRLAFTVYRILVLEGIWQLSWSNLFYRWGNWGQKRYLPTPQNPESSVRNGLAGSPVL